MPSAEHRFYFQPCVTTRVQQSLHGFKLCFFYYNTYLGFCKHDDFLSVNINHTVDY